MNTYINVCTIKSILVYNTARMHTQRKTSILVHFHMQMPPTPAQLRLVSHKNRREGEGRHSSHWLRRLVVIIRSEPVPNTSSYQVCQMLSQRKAKHGRIGKDFLIKFGGFFLSPFLVLRKTEIIDNIFSFL